jgi:hypothetical protein
MVPFVVKFKYIDQKSALLAVVFYEDKALYRMELFSLLDL